MVESATIRRRNSSRDAAGGMTVSYADVATVPMRLSPLGSIGSRAQSEDDAELVGRVTSIRRWVGTGPYGIDVALTDRVVIAGRTFEVDAIDQPRSNGTAVRVVLIEVT